MRPIFKIKKTYYIYFVAVLLAFLFVEIILRFKYGFCASVLLREDPDYEYIFIPQETTRFGSYSFYNQYSQRNREIAGNDSLIILGFGDSVLNGGILTSQDSLATSLLSSYLSKNLKKNTLVANISAGSWGPDNSYAYLSKTGNFNAKLILLQVSSHDAYDNMDFTKVVGKNPSYPDKQYKSAFWELLDRYILPKFTKHLKQTSNLTLSDNDLLRINKYKKGAPFNKGFHDFKKYADSTNIPLLVYLHAEKIERISRKYNSDGQKIIRFCQENNVQLIKELDFDLPLNAYRDKIHLSDRGQKYMFDILRGPICNQINKMN